jgi:hypothetical protein
MKIHREPLIHFLLLGALIFAVYQFRTRHKTDKPGEIVVTQGTLENLTTGFTRTWQRPPTEEELRGLVRDYIREEAAYREAVAMGLDRDDTVVRRRLRQKLEFLSDDLASRAEPAEADLQKFLQTHSSLFESEPRFSFRQVYLNPQVHGANLQRDAALLLAELRHAEPQTNNSNAGDPFLLPQVFQDAPLSEVKQELGDQFASALGGFPPGQWQGPVKSAYGSHLVIITEQREGRLPPLAEVRGVVRREWLNAMRTETTDRFYEGLLSRYTVKIEPPEEKKAAQVR